MKKIIREILSRLEDLRGRKDTGSRVERLLLKEQLKEEYSWRTFWLAICPSWDEDL